MLKLLEKAVARPVLASDMLKAVLPSRMHVTGDAELAMTLRAVAELIGADGVALHVLSSSNAIGECLASVGLSAGCTLPAAVRERHRRPEPDLIDTWLDTGPDGALIHLSVLKPRARDRIALLCRYGTARQTAQLALEGEIVRCLPLIERSIAHWAQAHVVGLHLREERSTFDSFGFGFMVLDHDSRIQMANDAARSMIARSGAFGTVADRLTILHLEDAMRFQVTLQRLLSADGASDEAVMLALRCRTGRPLLLAMRRVHASPGQARFATVQINDPAAELVLPLDALARHYDLTPAERRLIEQLVGGLTLGEAATALRLKEHTARTYLKHIFQKTGLRRQIELVRMVLSGTVPRLAATV